MFDYRLIKPKIKAKNITFLKHNKISINPYFGCTHRCLFCPANDGFLKKQVFDDFRENNRIYVIENIIDHLKSNIGQDIVNKPTIHLSPVTDPFQPIENKFKLSQLIIEYCAGQNIPIAICTKSIIPYNLFSYLKHNVKSFVQYSIPSIVEEKRKFIIKGDSTDNRTVFQNIHDIVMNGINVIVRVDPIYPFISDDLDEFEQLIMQVKDLGVRYILSSVADIYGEALNRETSYLESYETGLANKYRNLYIESIGNRMHAKLSYRKKIFHKMSLICKKHDISFGITWEPTINGEKLENQYNHGAPQYY